MSIKGFLDASKTTLVMFAQDLMDTESFWIPFLRRKEIFGALHYTTYLLSTIRTHHDVPHATHTKKNKEAP